MEAERLKREADIKDSEEDINTLKEFLKDKCDLPAKESRRLAESFVVDFEWHSTKRLSKAFVEGSLQSKLALFQPKVKREDVESIYSAIRSLDKCRSLEFTAINVGPWTQTEHEGNLSP